jgi:hypothetical protein
MPVALSITHPDPWCVFVSGSRDLTWDHEPLILKELKPFSGPYAVLIHGMGEGRTEQIPGCDRVADKVAQDLGFHIIACRALWELQGKSAGPVRNKLCAKILIAHRSAGYRLAMLAFSTGGPGTESALASVRSEMGAVPVQIEKFTVTL